MLSQKSHYALRALLVLAARGDSQPVQISEIADSANIPRKFLEQILLELKRGGVLESRRGVKGGYTLARAPVKISIGEVLRIVDGAFAESSCTHSSERLGTDCVEGPSCGLKGMWGDVQVAVEKILFATSLEDVRRRTLEGRRGCETVRVGIKSEVRRG